MLPGEGCGPLYGTQQRHLRRSAELLGLAGSERLAGEVAELLDLDGLEHGRARARIRSARGPRERGQAVVSVLLALDPGRYERLLAAGHRVGLWGRPWRIDPATGRHARRRRIMSQKSLRISPEALWRNQWVAQIETRVLAGEALGQAIAKDSIPTLDEGGFKELASHAAKLEGETGAEASILLFAWAAETGDYAAATMAVKALYRGSGARRKLREYFDRHVDLESASETDRSLLRCVHGESESNEAAA